MSNPERATSGDLIGPECLYWTAPEFGAVVRVSDKSVYRLIKTDPTFPAVKIAGSVRIPKDRALKWLRDREQGSGPRRLRAVVKTSGLTA